MFLPFNKLSVSTTFNILEFLCTKCRTLCIFNVDTEIDWKAYMSQVEGVVNGTWDNSQLRDITGSIIYPTGLMYFFTVLYYFTNYGEILGWLSTCLADST